MNEEKIWCKLRIVINCGSTEDALNVIKRIIDEEEHPPAVHQNAIALVEIERQ